MKEIFNPILPSNEYMPDVEPHIFDGRVYLYGSHDKFNGSSFCLLDYVCYSAPVDDLKSFRYEGVIYKRSQDPNGRAGSLNAMYAPDVCKGSDGRYYLYYFIGYYGLISVAVCDKPAGEYSFLGYVKYSDGTPLGKRGEPLQFDPGVFVDDDGEIYLYTGFSPLHYPRILMRGHKASDEGAMGFRLDKDMLTIKEGPIYIGVPGEKRGRGTGYEGHEFFEASSMRKINNKYYFVYSSRENHELCYAISNKPLSGFKYGGVLVSIGDVGINGFTRKRPANYLGNTHGGILSINNKHYIFYHRQTNRNSFSRQCCSEEIKLVGDKFIRSMVTSCGLNGGPLEGKGEYSAHIVCNLYSDMGSYYSGVFKNHNCRLPYLTENINEVEPQQYIKSFQAGSHAIYKYFNFNNIGNIKIEISGRAKGVIVISSNNTVVGKINITAGKAKRIIEGELNLNNGVADLSFTMEGRGKINLYSFNLS